MPHCIIEHSLTLDPNLLLEAVCKGAIDSALFETSDIKTRTVAYEHFQTNASQRDFVHVVVKILSGRSLDQQTELAQLVLSQLKALALASTSLTVEVVEMQRESYAKHVN